MVRVTENYRPRYNGDHMLLTIENIEGITDCPNDFLVPIDVTQDNNDNYRIVLKSVSATRLVDIIKNFIVMKNISQPCNISIYSRRVVDIEYLQKAIGNLLDLKST